MNKEISVGWNLMEALVKMCTHAEERWIMNSNKKAWRDIFSNRGKTFEKRIDLELISNIIGMKIKEDNNLNWVPDNYRNNRLKKKTQRGRKQETGEWDGKRYKKGGTQKEKRCNHPLMLFLSRRWVQASVITDPEVERKKLHNCKLPKRDGMNV